LVAVPGSVAAGDGGGASEHDGDDRAMWMESWKCPEPEAFSRLREKVWMRVFLFRHRAGCCKKRRKKTLTSKSMLLLLSRRRERA
jgi:hypothetical protein